MNKKNYTGYIIGGILVVVAIWFITTFNGLVNKEEKVKLQWNEVQNAYQRRLDLIPNLVNVVKGGADYEQTTLQKVTEARAKAAGINVSGDISAEKYNQQSAAQDELAGAANRLMVTVEKYPDLKGTKAFSDLQAQLEGTENRINVARQRYNQAVEVFNASIRKFPESLTNKFLLHLERKEYFKAAPEAKEAPKVKF